MGLDMYLRAKRYVSGYEFSKEDDRRLYRDVVAAIAAESLVDPETPSATISVTVAYWRKANHIHRWFVENVQGGEDECRPHYVDRAQLEDLRALCQKALASRETAPEVLPTQEGFFFGGTEYDEYYFQDLENTIAQLDCALKAGDDFTFEYQSSW